MSEELALGAPQGNVAEYTVSELSFAIKRTVEGAFEHVRLRGEVSGFRGPHTSGHCYFALKDDKARIEAVIWRGVYQRLKLKPEEGMEVIVQGRVSTYPGSSKYQIVIESLEPAGIGALLAQLEKLKQKLAAEGLFAEERKRPLPFMPRVVGVVTSPSGAVIRDMLHGFEERFPTRVVIWPVRVQGETCAAEVAAAVRGFNALPGDGPVPRPDLIIVARGGGSLEDLWGFNSETVARAVADSQLPVVSAVGHETDWTLIDWVADARAPTPTKAAEWAVPRLADLVERSDDLRRRARQALRRCLEAFRARLAGLARGIPRRQDLLALPRQRFDACAARLPRALSANTHAHALRLQRCSVRLGRRLLTQRLDEARARLRTAGRGLGTAFRHGVRAHGAELRRCAERLDGRLLAARVRLAREGLGALEHRARQCFRQHVAARRAQLDGCGKLLASVSYHGVLERGFALVRDTQGGTVRRAAAVAPGARLDVEFADGRVPVRAQKGERDAAPLQPRRRATHGPQGSLL